MASEVSTSGEVAVAGDEQKAHYAGNNGKCLPAVHHMYSTWRSVATVRLVGRNLTAVKPPYSKKWQVEFNCNANQGKTCTVYVTDLECCEDGIWQACRLGKGIEYEKVTNLPLVSSAYEMVSAVYNNTKENHPYMKTVCDVAEQGVMAISAVAVSGAKPIMNKLEPQIAAANEYACMGLDKLEEKLPILQQSTPQVVADTKVLVSSTITGAKDAVSDTVTGVVDMAKGAVHNSIEMTRNVVVEGVNTVMTSKVGQMVATGVDNALNKSEEMVDHYLPLTEEELAKLATSTEGFEVAPVQESSYYVRLGSLSSKVRHRAYQHSTAKMQKVRQSSQEIISQLHNTMDLIEFAKKGVDSANQKLHGVQEKLHQSWDDWVKNQPDAQVEDQSAPKTEQLESRMLTMTHGLTQQLQTTCRTLVSNVHGLPQHIQDKVQQIRKTAETIHTSLSSAHSFGDLSGQLLAQSREQMMKIRESMDGVMDYVLHNTPLNWMVGPFAPQLTENPQSPPEEMIAMDEIKQ